MEPLRLECMRILDVADSWSSNAHKGHGSKLNFLKRFQASHTGLTLLQASPPLKPPNSAAMGLAWAEAAHSAQDSPLEGKDRVAFGSVRAM